MSGPDALVTITRAWRTPPARSAAGSAQSELAVALWVFQPRIVHDMAGGPLPDTHIVSVPVSGVHRSTYFGDGRIRYNKLVEPWQVNVVRAGEQPRALLDVEAARTAYLHVYLPTRLVDDLVAHLDGVGPRAPELHDPCSASDVWIAAIARELLTELKTGAPLTNLRIDALGQDLAIQLLRRHSNLSQRLDRAGLLAKGGLAPWQVRRVSEYLEDHLADDVTLSDLSKLLDLSTFHLCRMFKQSTGLPPHRWRHQKRMERARALLEATNDPITEIAAAVGYDNPGRFAAAFRKAFGLTPRQHRRERRS